MTLDEWVAMGQALIAKHGGKAQVFLRDHASTDPAALVRLESITATTATIFDLGNGIAAWTLDEEQPGTQVPVIVLD